MHQNTLFRTEWLGYIRRWGISSITTKSLQYRVWIKVRMASYWIQLGAGPRVASSWARTSYSAQCPQCSMKSDELWWQAIVTLQTQIKSSIDSCCQFLLRNRSASEAEESQWLWGIQLSRLTGPWCLALGTQSSGAQCQEPGISPGGNTAVSVQSCIWVRLLRTARATQRWSWRSQAGCVHPGHTIHHSYQKPTAEGKLPALSCSH